ncbi:MAG: FliA/WhiG family RNA polymerase sigma factor [Desulfovibrionaceae bacterium]|nr:FliA/WhiG family RNA polymerase sigma factor [Desulfovibrionaceae bacterium]
MKSEPSLWESFENGEKSWADTSAKEKECIVRHYAPKIRYIALRMKSRLPNNVALNEMISAGSLGLMEALGKYQPEMGIRFDTYAENRIRGSMLDELRHLDWMPRSLRRRMRMLDEVMQNLEHETGHSPSDDELARASGLPIEDIREAREALHSQIWLSLDAIENSPADEPRASGLEPAEIAENRELIERLAALVDCLTPNEKLVLSLYYADGMTMYEISRIMNITEGRISQLHSQGVRRLRRALLDSPPRPDEA